VLGEHVVDDFFKLGRNRAIRGQFVIVATRPFALTSATVEGQVVGIFAVSMFPVGPPLSLVCILVGVCDHAVAMFPVVDVFVLVSFTGDFDRLAASMYLVPSW